jgi:ABC-type cobalamin/Fe3+-siderophores transport system ATPase subunit
MRAVQLALMPKLDQPDLSAQRPVVALSPIKCLKLLLQFLFGDPMNNTYARFWKCALQVNPASYSAAYRGQPHDGLDENAYNQGILQKCQELDIKVVGIADHGNVDAIDALRAVLEPAGIVVFPGFEISSTEKVHMVCLFPEGTGKDQLNRYLGSLGVTDFADAVRPSSKGCLEIARLVQEELHGFWFAAHMIGKNGLLCLKAKDGGGLTHIWKDHHLVRAGQIPGAISALEDSGVQQIINNKDIQWHREAPIAVLNAKDVAKPDDLADPGATCWIKMTTPCFESFRTAFFDPESRIRLNSDAPEQNPAAFVAMRMTGGYLDGVTAEFSPHLNTVIGGRGTGKSTLLECLRYALDIPPKGKQASRLHDEIIKENLGKASGCIEVDVISSAQNNRLYQVSRRYGEPPIVRDKASGEVSSLQPGDLLPGIEIYGQNEIFEMSQDAQSHLRLLDRFLPNESEFKVRQHEVKKRLSDNRLKLNKAREDLDDAQAQVAKLPKLQEQLQSYESLGIKEKLAKTPLFARERQLVQRTRTELERLQEGLATLEDSLPDASFLSEKALEGLPDGALLAPMGTALQQLRATVSAKLAEMKAALSQAKQDCSGHVASWKAALVAGEAELEKTLRGLPDMAGRSGQEVGTALQRLLKDVERIKPMQARMDTLEKLRAAQQQERRNLLAELSDIRAQRTAVLQKAAKTLNQKLAGKLKVLIHSEALRAGLKDFLVQCHFEGVGEKRLSWIDEAQALTPLSLVALIRKGQEALQAGLSMTPMVADALSKMPESKVMELEELSLDDRVEIQLNVAHGEASPDFRPLNRLSTGQQCTAILHLLLLENTDPLIVDQPEDNLDNAFIAERIVRELRKTKTHRQFLFATHNANIPVFGDAEWIGVFQSTGEQATLGAEQQGSIDVEPIRKQVAEILEGGKEAFLRRKEKYEF